MKETWQGMKGRALFAVEDVRFHMADNIQKYEVTSKKHSCSVGAMISICLGCLRTSWWQSGDRNVVMSAAEL